MFANDTTINNNNNNNNSNDDDSIINDPTIDLLDEEIAVSLSERIQKLEEEKLLLLKQIDTQNNQIEQIKLINDITIENIITEKKKQKKKTLSEQELFYESLRNKIEELIKNNESLSVIKESQDTEIKRLKELIKRKNNDYQHYEKEMEKIKYDIIILEKAKEERHKNVDMIINNIIINNRKKNNNNSNNDNNNNDSTNDNNNDTASNNDFNTTNDHTNTDETLQ